MFGCSAGGPTKRFLVTHVQTPDLVKTLYTKDTPVIALTYTRRNTLLAAGNWRGAA